MKVSGKRNSSAQSMLQQLSIAEQIAEQQRIEGPQKSDIKPLETPVVAKGHPPIYRMHRFFARRPYNVFEALIKHYSNPGDIVLDPFCGGGVTLVEGLRSKRKIVGVDINPMATFVTQMEVASVDIDRLDKARQQLSKTIKKDILKLYETSCPKCKEKAIAAWIESAYIVQCPSCHKPVNLGEAKKMLG